MEFDFIEFLDKYVFPEVCTPRSFKLLDPVAERHGSWEWAFYKKADELNRFVSVALASLPTSVPDGPSYQVEVWAGADDDSRFTRHLVSDFRTLGREKYTSEIRFSFEQSLGRAMDMAESFKRPDLTDAYLPSRSRR